VKTMERIKEKVIRHTLIKTWHLWEKLGFYVVPKHFHFPIPETSKCRDHEVDNEFPMNGVSLDDCTMLSLLRELARFNIEYAPTFSPTGFESNGDGAILYGMVRKWKPKRIIEVGSGSSTEVSAYAMQQNEARGSAMGEILAIEPYPKAKLQRLVKENPCVKLLVQPAEEVDLGTFQQLEMNDILFIDSSHIIKCGNDVHYLYLRILPQIPVGTLVHIHDIRFPQDYPKDWLLTKKYFWNEQYLLQMFLSFNDSFEVVFASNYMRLRYPKEMQESLVGLDSYSEGWPGSFWMRRIK
jgi:predicted O-methyltransferase YrrM